MRKVLILLAALFVGVSAWRAGGTLSSDAVSMAVGVVFGVRFGCLLSHFLPAPASRDDVELPDRIFVEVFRAVIGH